MIIEHWNHRHRNVNDLVEIDLENRARTKKAADEVLRMCQIQHNENHKEFQQCSFEHEENYGE